MSVNYPGSPDPRLWVERKRYEADMAKVKAGYGARISALEDAILRVKTLIYAERLDVKYVENPSGTGDGKSHVSPGPAGDYLVSLSLPWSTDKEDIVGWCYTPDGKGRIYKEGEVFEPLLNPSFAKDQEIGGYTMTVYAIWR